jgi:hypothetical protein
MDGRLLHQLRTSSFKPDIICQEKASGLQGKTALLLKMGSASKL